MLKQSPNRGHKSKGIKVKHILQICVLLAVCFWLIYQVRNEFDTKDEPVVNKVKLDNEILKFGRKDLPRVTESSKVGEKHVEDDEEKVAEEEDIKLEEEEIKHEADEIDENELEKKEGEHEDGDEQVDEDKEREDDDVDLEENHTENEEKAFPGKEENFEALENEEAEEIQDVVSKDQDEKDDASDDQDHDGDNVDTHEAREEHYKADDASSEVAQHVQTIIPKIENATKGRENDMFGKSDASDGISNGSVFEQHNSENSTSANFLKNQVETASNLTSLDKKHRRLSNGLQLTFNPNVPQNAIVEGASGNKDPNLVDKVWGDNNRSDLPSAENIQSKASGLHPNKTENVSTNVEPFNATIQSSMSNENHDEKLKSSKNEDARLGQSDPIDEADANVVEEEIKSRLDLDTLPGIRTEGQNSENALSE